MKHNETNQNTLQHSSFIFVLLNIIFYSKKASEHRNKIGCDAVSGWFSIQDTFLEGKFI